MKIKTDVFNIKELTLPKSVLECKNSRLILVPLDWEIEDFDENSFSSIDFMQPVPELKTPLILNLSEIIKAFKQQEKINE